MLLPCGSNPEPPLPPRSPPGLGGGREQRAGQSREQPGRRPGYAVAAWLPDLET